MKPMGFAKAKSQTRTANTTMTIHQEATASSREPEKLSLAMVQVARGTCTQPTVPATRTMAGSDRLVKSFGSTPSACLWLPNSKQHTQGPSQ